MAKRDWYLLGIIVIAAAFFRFFLLTELPPGLYPDEAMNGNNALEAIKTGEWKVFYPENNGREGLFMNIQAVSLMLFGVNEPWALRFPSPIFGTLTVVGFFFLLYELALLSRLRSPILPAFLGSFFMATSFWHINFSRIGFRAIMAPFFLVWGAYFLLFAFRSHRFRAAILAGAAIGLGFYSYIAYRVMPAVFIIFVPYFIRRRAFWHIAAGAIISAVIVALPLFAYYVSNPSDFLGRTSQVSIFQGGQPARDLAKNTALTIGMIFAKGDGNWRHNIAGAPQVFYPVAFLFFLGLFRGIRRFAEYDKFFFIWFILAMLPVVISNEGIPHALRAILMIPPIMGIAASGGEWIWRVLEGSWRAKYRNALAAAFFALLFAQAYYAYFIAWGSSEEAKGAFAESHVAVGKAVNAMGYRQDTYIVVGGGVDVRGVPMPAQTVMFITDSFLPEDRAAKRIHYLTRPEYEAGKSLLDPRYVFFAD